MYIDISSLPCSTANRHRGCSRRQRIRARTAQRTTNIRNNNYTLEVHANNR